MLIASADGVVAGGSQDDEQDVFIETGGEEEFSIYTSYIAKALLGENLDEINATVDVTFFRSEYQKLGEHEVPETPEAPKVLNNAIDVGDFIKINGMLLYRSKPDEDGDIKLELVMGMRNVSDIHFDKVELKMTLNDRKGAEIDYSTDYGQLPPYSGRVMNPSIWGLSEARLKNCTVNISLDIYQPVAYATHRFGQGLWPIKDQDCKRMPETCLKISRARSTYLDYRIIAYQKFSVSFTFNLSTRE